MEWDIDTGADRCGQALTGKPKWVDDSSFRMICRADSPDRAAEMGRRSGFNSADGPAREGSANCKTDFTQHGLDGFNSSPVCSS